MRKFFRVIFLVFFLLAISAPDTPAAADAPGQKRPDHRLNSTDHYAGIEQSIAALPEALPADTTNSLINQRPEVFAIPYTRYVFQSFRNENWEIYSSDGDFSLHTRLTNNAAPDIHPRLSPDGTKIVFSSKRTVAYELYTMNIDGSNLIQVTNSGRDNVNPDWSPDGTQIVFQSHRDGQAEIYKINADGSKETRLTDENTYDGEPVWSPDGTKIAFVSQRIYPWGIWLMNPDGSGLSQLVHQSYAESPTWSPDGTQIAFDADFNNDTYLELAVVGVNKGWVNILYSPSQKDAWARSWSPDGRYILFTEISFIYYNGSWYWVDAFGRAYDRSTGLYSTQLEDGTLWNPDITSTENIPPTASLDPLPAVVPTEFTVSWSGTDQGPIGLLNFDVQVRDGTDGLWTDWRQQIGYNSAIFSGGIGGHTYYFRVRSRDLYGNLSTWTDGTTNTQIENAAPFARISLPEKLNNKAAIEWSGTDFGGSGVLSYDAQYRDSASLTWHGWMTATQQTGGTFSAPLGHNYYFRVRAVDRALNIGPWQNTSTAVRLCNWGMEGRVLNNTGSPVSGAEIYLTSAESIYTGVLVTETTTTSADGRYSFCSNTPSNTYTLGWYKPGYGSLPSSIFPQAQKGPAQIVLPPALNTLNQGDFEQGMNGWTVEGDVPGSITTTIFASGSHSGLLGIVKTGIQPALHPIDSSLFASAMTKDGVLHIVRNDFSYGASQYNLYHQYLLPTGDWSAPEQIESNFKYINKLALFADDRGRLNLGMYACPDFTVCYFYFKQRNSQGVWGPLELGDTFNNISSIGVAVTANGDTYVLRSTENNYIGGTQMIFRQANLNYWLKPELFTGNSTFVMQPDKIGGLDLMTAELLPPVGVGFKLFQRKSNHLWLPTNWIYASNYGYVVQSPKFVVETNGIVHTAFTVNDNTYVSDRDLAGNWSPYNLNVYYGHSSGDLKTDQLGNTYLFLRNYYNPGILSMAIKPASGAWSPVAPIFTYGDSPVQNVVAATDARGRLHILSLHEKARTLVLFYILRNENGIWEQPIKLSEAPYNYGIRMIDLQIDQNQEPHILWVSNYKLYYAGPNKVEQISSSGLETEVSVNENMIPGMRLSFLYNIQNTGSGPVNFTVSVGDSFGETPVFTATNITDGWQQGIFDLQPWDGQIVNIHFRLEQIPGHPGSWAYIDDVSAGSSPTDVWVDSASKTALPGSQVTYALRYGNNGSVHAENVVITHTLPAGLTFVSASLPISPTLPLTATIQTITWTLGTLPGNFSGIIYITATLSKTLHTGVTLDGALTIASLSPELEIANNYTQTKLFIGHRVFLPIIKRK